VSDDTDRRLAAALAAEYERHRADAAAPGGPRARATVTRRRRQAAAAGVASLVLVVAAGVGLVRGSGTPDRLVSATPAVAPATTPPATPTDTLSEIHAPACGDPAAKYRDRVRIDDVPATSGWTLTGPTARIGDLDRDGRDEYVAFLRCATSGDTWLVALTNWNADLAFTGHAHPLDTPGPRGIGVEDDGVVRISSRYTDTLVRWTGDHFVPIG
jgi:hypothetical protein